MLHKIENYIDDRQPHREDKKSPQKAGKGKDKRQPSPSEKNENRYQPSNYLKSPSSKHIELGSPKNNRPNSIAELGRSKKNIKIVDEQKMEGLKPAQNKYYGQNLEKEKQEDHDITQNDQSKLI